MKFEWAVLENGLRVVAEVNPHAVSTAVGFFVRAGARDETSDLSGVSHFLEHMAFKGTSQRSGDDINRLFDDIGAKYNAYTSEEHTVYHAAILPEYLPACVDLLGDLLRPALRTEDFETERTVIIEEIGMYADSPMWSAYDRAVHRHFSNHPLGQSILGTKESIEKLSVESMRAYHRQRYSPSNITLAASGRIDFPSLIELAEAQCHQWPSIDVDRVVSAPSRTSSREIILRKEFTLETIAMITSAPCATDALRIAGDVLAVIIGDETGSRFYWELVDPGRVDSIDMTYHEYEGAGAFIISAACEPASADENLTRLFGILEDVMRRGVTADELSQAKSKLKARVVLAAERPRNRLFPVGYNWIYRGEYRSLEKDLADLEAVTLDDIRQLLDQHQIQQTTTVCLGPLESLKSLGISADGCALNGSSRRAGAKDK